MDADDPSVGHGHVRLMGMLVEIEGEIFVCQVPAEADKKIFDILTEQGKVALSVRELSSFIVLAQHLPESEGTVH